MCRAALYSQWQRLLRQTFPISCPIKSPLHTTVIVNVFWGALSCLLLYSDGGKYCLWKLEVCLNFMLFGWKIIADHHLGKPCRDQIRREWIKDTTDSKGILLNYTFDSIPRALVLFLQTQKGWKRLNQLLLANFFTLRLSVFLVINHKNK